MEIIPKMMKDKISNRISIEQVINLIQEETQLNKLIKSKIDSKKYSQETPENTKNKKD